MNKKITLLIAVISLPLLWLNGCKLDGIESNEMYAGYDYYPLAEQRFTEYQVYDTFYNGTTTIDTTYYLKEVITEQWVDGDETWYKVNRYTKTISSTFYPLQPDSVWGVCNNDRQLVRRDNNFDFVRISFPVKKNKIWDGNVRNVYDSVPYTISWEDQPATVNGQTFPRTLKVVESDRNFLYEVNQQHAIYASGVGMIERDYLKLEKGSQPGNMGVLLYRQRTITRLVSYGTE